ncbi:MAG: hypothetical protein HZA70_04725 [Planctomycetes bacterium]|nr:hypothetical protein [Planctomycetota bacterium]
MQTVDIVFDVLLLVTACTVLVFLIKASSTLKLTTLNRGILLLYLLIALEIADDVMEFFVTKEGVTKEGVDEHLLTLDALILALVATAIYYATKGKRIKSTEPMGAAIICAVWLVVAHALLVFFIIFW